MSACVELEAVNPADPLAAALLEIASLNEQLNAAAKDRANWEARAHAEERERHALVAKMGQHYNAYQKLLHENERLREQLGAEVRAAKTGGYELEVHCDTRDCVTPPIRIAKAPPEDAIHLWVNGMGWGIDGDRYLCPYCKGGK